MLQYTLVKQGGTTRLATLCTLFLEQLNLDLLVTEAV